MQLTARLESISRPSDRDSGNRDDPSSHEHAYPKIYDGPLRSNDHPDERHSQRIPRLPAD
jgi:hypothetical protein